MSSIYACPIHVDRQSTDPHRLCALCGQRPVLLRAAPDLGSRVQRATTAERTESAAAAGADQRAGAPPPQVVEPAELVKDIDQAIELLSSIRDRLRALA